MSTAVLSKIAFLNDALRGTFQGGKVVMTAAVAGLEAALQARVLQAARTFKDFTRHNDPHGEHDCFFFQMEGERYFENRLLRQSDGVRIGESGGPRSNDEGSHDWHRGRLLRCAMLANTRRIYALADYSVEGRGDQWFYWRTARFGDKEEKRGPYSSLASVTLMIARAMKREVIKRDSVHKLPE